MPGSALRLAGAAVSQSMRRFSEWKESAGLGGDVDARGLDERTPPEQDREGDSATRIGRFYLRRKHYSQYVDRVVLLQRLQLEDNLETGCLRLLIYCIIFACVVISFGSGAPSSERIRTLQLLNTHLDLEDFREIRDLESLRDYLPHLSERLKGFSATSSRRFSNPSGIELLENRQELLMPRPMFTAQIELEHTPFTLSAWVEILPSARARTAVSILRKPTKADPSLNCWAWNFPSEFRYGGQNGAGANVEANVEGRSAVQRGKLLEQGKKTHVAVTVAGMTIVFYLNGSPLGPAQRLPRPITDCLDPATLLLGQEGVALSAVRFYPRALQEHEVREMFLGGQPLVQVATGSTLQPVEESELMQLGEEGRDGIAAVLRAMEAAQHADIARELRQPDHERENEGESSASDLHDPSPPAVLPRGQALVSALPPDERAAWEASGMPTDGFLVEQWQQQSASASSRFFVLWDRPLHTDGSVVAQLPSDLTGGLQPEPAGFTVAFWFKPHVKSVVGGPRMFFERNVDGQSLSLGFELFHNFVLAQVSVRGGGADPEFDMGWDYLTYFDQETGQISEEFLLGPFLTESEGRPRLWRYIAYAVDLETGDVNFFLDGRLAWVQRLTPLAGLTINQVLGNATVEPHRWFSAGVVGKMASFHIHPRVLNGDDILTLHEMATWAPTTERKRQCTDMELDYAHYDFPTKDSFGRSCEWYSQHKDDHPFVCATDFAKTACPATCNHRVRCHDGSLLPSFRPKERRVFHATNRVLHAKPRPGAGSVLCVPNHQREELLRSCEQWAPTNETARNPPGEAPPLWELIRTRYAPDLLTPGLTDLANCSALEAAMDAEGECGYDTSWLPEFVSEHNASGSWSASFWMRPMEGALGMPDNFYFAVNLFAGLSPPSVLTHWSEANPQSEPWMNARTEGRLLSGGEGRVSIIPTTDVDYTEWTFFHSQLERRTLTVAGEDTDRYLFCASLNDIPLRCVFLDEPPLDPHDMLSAVEFSAEVLVGALEVSAQAYTPAQVQRKYYEEREQMQKLDREPVAQDAASAGGRAEKELLAFDKEAMLVAPPLLFHTRRESQPCASSLTAAMAEAQLDLMREAHCAAGASCSEAMARPESVVSCSGELTDVPFFGMPPTTLHGQRGFSEFLYVVADNEEVVRGQATLKTRALLDARTNSVDVIAILHVAGTSLTVELQLAATVTGALVETNVHLRSLAYLDEEQRLELRWKFGCLFGAVLLSLVMSARSLRRKVEVMTAIDVLLALVVLVTGAVVLHRAIGSETRCLSTVMDIASVPVASPELSLDAKVERYTATMNKLDAELQEEQQVENAAFAIMILLLLRVIESTDVHPRIRALVGTAKYALDDIMHFTLLFVAVFLCLSVTATWVFGAEREDFATLEASMSSQFQILLGALPRNFADDDRMAVYVSISSVVQFFLMLNFLLAIIVEGYMRVRQEIRDNLSEYDFLTDVLLTLRARLRSAIAGWPSRRHVAAVLRTQVASRKVSFYHLRLQGLPASGRDLFNHYASLSNLQTDPPMSESESKATAAMADALISAPAWSKTLTAQQQTLGDRHDSLDDRLDRMEDMIRRLCRPVTPSSQAPLQLSPRPPPSPPLPPAPALLSSPVAHSAACSVAETPQTTLPAGSEESCLPAVRHLPPPVKDFVVADGSGYTVSAVLVSRDEPLTMTTRDLPITPLPSQPSPLPRQARSSPPSA